MSLLSISTLDTFIQEGEKNRLLYRVEMTDALRAFCGALFVALPLHMTAEMWERARAIPSWDIAIVLVLAFFANVGYNSVSGFKHHKSRSSIWFDAVSCLGIGLVASLLTMLLIDQITIQIPFPIVLKLLALQSVLTGFGASLAKNQLGGGDAGEEEEISGYAVDYKRFLSGSLGALLYSLNIAPTIETIQISSSINGFQLIVIVLYSLLLSYLFVFVANFSTKSSLAKKGRIMDSAWSESLISYLIALLVSAGLLWLFGYIDLATPLSVSLPWIAVLGYVTTMGSSAGRLIF
ncbi:DUF2391 family protein [Flavilitoribacter nigricans]|uniref:DUF2391 family protein n=1 Tax=Flavilitoribacter nigricans TaxID=70997 RepID=UPI0014748B15|nr:DUF2391 family protein [Flavilitoribacter nigricans]